MKDKGSSAVQPLSVALGRVLESDLVRPFFQPHPRRSAWQRPSWGMFLGRIASDHFISPLLSVSKVSPKAAWEAS